MNAGDCQKGNQYPVHVRAASWLVVGFVVVIHGVCPFQLTLFRYAKHQPGGPPEFSYSFTRFNRSAFITTDTELKLMAAAAMIGESSRPKNGYSTPAAIGMPSTL